MGNLYLPNVHHGPHFMLGVVIYHFSSNSQQMPHIILFLYLNYSFLTEKTKVQNQYLSDVPEAAEEHGG